MSEPARPPTDARARAIADEQPYVTRLYERLDLLRERTAARLRDLFRQHGSTHQAVWERDVFVARDVDRLARLDAVEPGLCFGRLDLADGERRYIGRIGLSDDDYEPMLIDWRAPAAEPFYRATPANPGDVTRRRHIRTSRRRVTAVDDEVFGLELPDGDGRATLSGEAALLASLQAPRTGRMSDIVATIQAEQDRIIRSELNGVLVVQGGPGTGKTVAALHRAAYLLYTHRDRLADRGVLVVGPNRTFLRYIEQVLPSLGETGVVLSSLGELVPGVTATGPEPADTAAVKGDARMVAVLKAAVRDRQRVPSGVVELDVDGATLRLQPETCAAARTHGRRSRRPHNRAREVFVGALLGALADQYHRRLSPDIDPDEEDLAETRSELAGEPAVQKMLDELWPVLTPAQLVREVLAHPARLRGLSAAERGALARRPAPHAWTVADVPLLDEAAELLGDADVAPANAAPSHDGRDPDTAYAEELLESLELDVPLDPEMIAARYEGPPERRTTAQRAAADRTWAFGHVIVDEAQELSPMAWRMVMRRCPARSMTLVGDLAQSGSAAAPGSWAEALDPYAAGRWRVEELAINYRTPTETMAVASAVLAEIDPDLTPPRSVRSVGVEPWARPVTDLESGLPDAVAAELDAIGSGRLGVIVPGARADEVAALLRQSGCEAAAGADPAALDSPAAVLTVAQAKGLEFDSVIVVEPDEIVAASERGMRDLYVAVTRTTSRLGVVHTGEVPRPLRTL